MNLFYVERDFGRLPRLLEVEIPKGVNGLVRTYEEGFEDGYRGYGGIIKLDTLEKAKVYLEAYKDGQDKMRRNSEE